MIERDPSTNFPISLASARSAGLTRYFTGVPCKHGHVAERFVGNRQCVECGRDHNARFYAGRQAEQQDRSREYYRANKDARCDYGKSNRDKTRRAVAKWTKANPDKKRAVENTRRARRYAAGGTYSASDIAEILKDQRGRCAYCPTVLTRTNRHIDHITALASGGTNHRRNLQMLCQPCNSSKGARDPIVFAQSIGRLL
jgi:5-methylcytosine-specific restriction endonuclease McrA